MEAELIAAPRIGSRCPHFLAGSPLPPQRPAAPSSTTGSWAPRHPGKVLPVPLWVCGCLVPSVGESNQDPREC